VGFRMVLQNPERVESLTVQDAVAHNSGLGANWKLQNRLHPCAGTKRDQKCTGSWALRRSFGSIFRDEEPDDSCLAQIAFRIPSPYTHLSA